MTNMKLTLLSTSEFKLDTVGDFCLRPYDNYMVLLGSYNDITILELMNSCETLILMPYSNKQVIIPQTKPMNQIIGDIDLVKIYNNATVQESQELALNDIYTAECAVDPLKSRALQADILTINDCQIFCMLTSYGYCEIYKKKSLNAEWKPLQTNLSNILISDVFPSEASQGHVKTFEVFKTFVDRFIITSFFMCLQFFDMIIYLGTAAGYIVALKYVESTQTFEKICYLKTSLNRICLIVKINNLILIACNQGKVRLLKINFESNVFEELDYLWSQADRMTCRKAIFTYDENLRSYLVVFSKAAHILVYRLDLEGAVLGSSTLYVSGIKISGIESLSTNEFIITTITGVVKYLRILLCSTKEELKIEEQIVEHEFDSANYQILGVAASASKTLWSFLLFRNKDYIHQSKYSSTTTFLNVCKLSIRDSFTKLINMNLKNMNMAHDILMAINLDIFGNQEHDKYTSYFDLQQIKFPKEFNDDFLQKLQIKIIILRKLAKYQILKYRKPKPQTKDELDILEPGIQMFNIISRLRYLKQLNCTKIKLTKFQESSIICMQLKFVHLLSDLSQLKIKTPIENNNKQKTIDNFLTYGTEEFSKWKFGTDNFAIYQECCVICNQPIKNFIKCELQHEVKRCSISSTQLALLKTKYCPHCFANVRNDEDAKLHELFSAEECIKCIYCRFLLKQNEY